MFSDFEEQFSAILDGARDLEMSLKDTASTVSDTTIPSLKELENGEKVAKIFNGLSDIYSKNKCSIHDDRILVTIADIITDVSRFGALAPGRVGEPSVFRWCRSECDTSSCQRALRKGFKFQDKNYRRSFIKLNCAFYDVRNEMESKGLFTIKTKEHETQLAMAEEVEKELTNLKKQNNDYIKNVFKEIEKRKEIL